MMEIFMFLIGLFMIIIIIMIRLIANQCETIKLLKKENKSLQYELAINPYTPNRDIVFDSQGGYKITEINNVQPETV